MATREKTNALLSLLRGNIGVLIWTRMLLFFALQMYTGYFPLYVQNLGGSYQDIGFVASLASTAALIIVPVAGYIADHMGRVKLIASSFYFRSLTYLTYALSTNWVMVAAGSFYDGLTQYNHAAQSAIMADSLPPGRRAVGFAALNTLPNFLSMIGPPVGAYLLTLYDKDLGMRYIFIFAALSMLAIGFFRQKLMTETLVKPASAAESKMSLGGAARLIAKSYRDCWEIIKWTPRNLGVFVLIEGLSSFAGAMVGSFWIIYATQRISPPLTVTEWGTILFAQGLLQLCISIPAGAIVDRAGNRRIIIIMLFLSLFHGYFFVFYSKTFIQTLALMLYVSAITAFIVPACMALLADMVPRPLRARVTSAYGRGTIGVQMGAGGAEGGYVITIPTIVGSIAGGFIYALNPTYPWLLQIPFLFVCLVLSIFFLKEPKVREI